MIGMIAEHAHRSRARNAMIAEHAHRSRARQCPYHIGISDIDRYRVRYVCTMRNVANRHANRTMFNVKSFDILGNAEMREEMRGRTPRPAAHLTVTNCPTPPHSIIVHPQIRSLNPTFPCSAFQVKASPSSPMQGLRWRLHSVNAPLTRRASAIAVMPSAV